MDYVQPVLIPLYRRDFLAGFALIDPEDAEKVQAHKWSLTSSGYALSSGNDLMHRLIAEPPEGEVVDHINGHRTDNRRQNLRVCGQQMNMYNTRRPRTKLRGVSLDKRSSPPSIRAEISVGGTKMSLGTFPSEIEAARAYDSASRQLHKEFGVLNFPDEVHHADVDWVAHIENIRARGPANKKLSEKDVQLIKEKVTAGHKISDLAQEFSVSESLVYFVNHGLRDAKKKVAPELLEEAIAKVKSGQAAYSVAREMGISLTALKKTLSLEGVSAETVYKKRADAKLSREDVQTILSRVQGGETQKSLAKEFGVSIACVNGYVRGKRRI